MQRIRRTTQDQLTKPNGEHLADADGGTSAGEPMERVGLLDFLEHGAHGASRGGAVSGAAQAVAGGPGGIRRLDRGIALSDGSRIYFASLVDADLVREYDEPMPGIPGAD